MDFYSYEDRKLISLIREDKAEILDVGCGQGRYLIPLSKLGHHVVGIDVSGAQVIKLRNMGYPVLLETDIDKIEIKFDYIIMSHVIEHIDPSKLIGFFDKYATKLKSKGNLIVATPFLYNEFYDDYDHVKPYTPKSLSILFSEYEQQQAKTKCRMVLQHVWLRKWPYILHSLPGENSFMKVAKTFMNGVFLIAYVVTGHLFSRKTGWIGVFENMNVII